MKHHTHETTVLGVFDNASQAYMAINAMEQEHIEKEDISLVADKEAYEREELVEMIAGEKLHEESLHAGKVGSLAGAVLAGLTALTGMLSAGASLLMAGPLIAIATGAGGILGALLGTGFTEEEARKIDNEVSQGKILVVVHAKDRATAHVAKDTLHDRGASSIRVHH